MRFRRAAHIKKRAACADQEARNLDHIAMLACLFGCDALFEAGYIAVNAAGSIIIADLHPHPSLHQNLTAARPPRRRAHHGLGRLLRLAPHQHLPRLSSPPRAPSRGAAMRTKSVFPESGG